MLENVQFVSTQSLFLVHTLTTIRESVDYVGITGMYNTEAKAQTLIAIFIIHQSSKLKLDASKHGINTSSSRVSVYPPIT